MAEGAAVATLAGTAFQVAGEIEESKAQQKAAFENADAKRAQAFEYLKRTETNIERLKGDAKKFKASQVAAFAASGVDVSSGATLLQLEETNSQLAEQITIERREARFTAENIIRGAEIDIETASQIRKSTPMRAAATGLSGGGKAFSLLG